LPIKASTAANVARDSFRPRRWRYSVCSDFLMCQLNQPVTADCLLQNGLQFLPVISAVAKADLPATAHGFQ
jgi:hypothetical protein